MRLPLYIKFLLLCRRTPFSSYRIVLLVAILTLANCHKDKEVTIQSNNTPEQLPPSTQEGKNTFGCRINDEVWLPKDYSSIIPSFGFYPANISYDRRSKLLYIFAFQITNEKNFKGINLYSKNIDKTGQFKLFLNIDKTTTAYSYRSPTSTNDDYYPINDTLNSVLTITKLDTISKIISGNFSFNFIMNDRIVNVHDGVFDLKLN